MEQTFIMMKPDGVQRGLVGEIIGRFKKKGFTFKGLKLINVDRSFAEKHYADLSAKPFSNGLVEYIISGAVVAMFWEGKNVVTIGRKIIGATNPVESVPGTIRGDYAIDIGSGECEERDWSMVSGGNCRMEEQPSPMDLRVNLCHELSQ